MKDFPQKNCIFKSSVVQVASAPMCTSSKVKTKVRVSINSVWNVYILIILILMMESMHEGPGQTG